MADTALVQEKRGSDGTIIGVNVSSPIFCTALIMQDSTGQYWMYTPDTSGILIQQGIAI